MSVRRPKAIALATAVVLLGAAAWDCSRTGPFEWSAPVAGTVVAESTAPGGALRARVKAGEKKGEYLFELVRRRGQVIATKKISAPIGYHEQRVSLRWSRNDEAIAVIDHDFGDGNVEFSLSPSR
jgi:hypothetical protein